MLRVTHFTALSMLLLGLVAGGTSLAGPSGATDGDTAGFARARAWFEGLG